MWAVTDRRVTGTERSSSASFASLAVKNSFLVLSHTRLNGYNYPIMSLIVQKYGGTSVADIEHLKRVAGLVAKRKESCDHLVVVLSAMSGQTDSLLAMAHQVCDEPDERELDMLLSSGERITVPLLAMILKSKGLNAISLTGRQSGIFTDGEHTKARIKNIEKERIERWLDKGYIAVVAGFQGYSEEADTVTTLGRGGSDTTAVAIAAALGADQCEIFTDVDGVYTTDPNVEPSARRLETISYEEMMEMAGQGAKVLQVRAVGVAAKYKMPILVRSSFTDGPGTRVVSEDECMESVLVSGVVYDKNQAKLTLTGIPDKPGVAAKIFEFVAAENINVDMIIQNVSSAGTTDLSLTVPNTEAKKALRQLEKAAKEVEAVKVLLDENIGKVSIVGIGMRSHTGIAARMFSVMAEADVNIQMISTSEIKVSCVIDKKDVEKSVRILHKSFELDGK